ncbi:MAG: GtrA family protein [Burkholderiales bacterium]|nr:GtrA family protein [Burkholderiales bacterium]
MKKIIKKIHRRHIKQVLVYGVVGLVALVVQMSLYLILCRVGLFPLYATLIGAVIGMFVAYCGHVRYTFEKKHKFSKSEFIKYILTACFGVLFNIVSVYILITLLKLHSDFGVIPMILSPGITFIINKFWSFK